MVRSLLSWSDRVPEKDGVRPQVHDMAFSPDGAQLIVACGNRVLMYNAPTGELQQSLKGHKDTLYCVAYSRDGKRFASGGADKTIIIWTAKAEGILKYSHNEAVQCLAYNPVTASLASATATDFGLWSPEQKAVTKHKVSSRVTCISWTNDGTCLALGHFSGHISLRDKEGGEQLVIERNAPVWSISWNPTRDEAYELLAVACWDQTLSFYDASGGQVGRDRSLGFDPCCVRHFANGEYLCVGGSDKQASLWTKEGVNLTSLLSVEGWVWSCEPRPGHNQLAVGSSDGSISVHQLIFATVHGLYRERYAYRDVMTDVVVHNMMSEQRLRIRCKDYVRKVAIYNVSWGEWGQRKVETGVDTWCEVYAHKEAVYHVRRIERASGRGRDGTGGVRGVEGNGRAVGEFGAIECMSEAAVGGGAECPGECRGVGGGRPSPSPFSRLPSPATSCPHSCPACTRIAPSPPPPLYSPPPLAMLAHPPFLSPFRTASSSSSPAPS
jgi:hypothetical protein